MKWISVKDRLPEDGECVMIYDEVEGVHKTFFVSKPYECEEGGFDKHGFAIVDIEFKDITYWMPLLPKPPHDEQRRV